MKHIVTTDKVQRLLFVRLQRAGILTDSMQQNIDFYFLKTKKNQTNEINLGILESGILF